MIKIARVLLDLWGFFGWTLLRGVLTLLRSLRKFTVVEDLHKNCKDNFINCRVCFVKNGFPRREVEYFAGLYVLVDFPLEL